LALEWNSNLKEKPDSIILISLFWTVFSIFSSDLSLLNLVVDLPMLRFLPEIFDTSSEIWVEFTIVEREYLNFALPVMSAINILLLSISLISFVIIFGIFTRKKWSYKPAFIIPIFSALFYGFLAIVYLLAPYELYFDFEFVLSLIFMSISLILLGSVWFSFRKSEIRYYILGSKAPKKLPISTKYSGTMEGDVIKAILSQGNALTWRELQNISQFDEKSLNFTLGLLIGSKDVFKVKGKYDVSKELQKEYSESLAKLKSEVISWIYQWNRSGKSNIPIENKHFFLQGRDLTHFSIEAILNAQHEIFVLNPFIEECNISNSLIEAKKRGIDVRIITQFPKNDKYPEKLKEQIKYQEKLKQEGLFLKYNNKIHAKIIIIDRTIALVSSMNFTPYSSSGAYWETGIVTTDQNIVNSITKSFILKIN